MMFVMLLMFGFSCTKETKVVNTPTAKQETDNKTLEVKSQVLVPWDEKKKSFWVAVYFAKMSFDPNMRQRYLPHNLHCLCVCIIDEFEKLYKLEEFEEKVQGNTTGQAPNPEVRALIWNISYGCSQVWMQKQMQELMEQKSQIPVNPV